MLLDPRFDFGEVSMPNMDEGTLFVVSVACLGMSAVLLLITIIICVSMRRKYRGTKQKERRPVHISHPTLERSTAKVDFIKNIDQTISAARFGRVGYTAQNNEKYEMKMPAFSAPKIPSEGPGDSKVNTDGKQHTQQRNEYEYDEAIYENLDIQIDVRASSSRSENHYDRPTSITQ